MLCSIVGHTECGGTVREVRECWERRAGGAIGARTPQNIIVLRRQQCRMLVPSAALRGAICDHACRERIAEDHARLRAVSNPTKALNDVARLSSAHLQVDRHADAFGCKKGPSIPSYLPWQAEEHQLAQRCFANKTVWFLGNSVSREMFFLTHKLLNGHQHHATQLSDEASWRQKLMCGRGGQHGGMRPDTGGTVSDMGTTQDCWGACACSVPQHHGGALNFGWIYHWANEKIESLLMGNATGRVPDVVVYNVGLPRMVCPSCLRDTQSLEQGATGLAAMVSRVLAAHPTMAFYWRTTTRVCYNQSGYDDANREISMINNVVSSHLCANPLVRRLDAFRWTPQAMCWTYRDGMHPSALLFHHATAFVRHHCGIGNVDGTLRTPPHQAPRR